MHTHNAIHIEIKACIEADANLFVRMCTGEKHAYLHTGIHTFIRTHTETCIQRIAGQHIHNHPITALHSHTHTHSLF